MPVRKAQAVWEGTLKDGKGLMRFGNGAFEGTFTAASRFEEGPGTNPEELIGAAHAGCFEMVLTLLMQEAGYLLEHAETEAKVHIDKMDGGYSITLIELHARAKVPGIDLATFRDKAEAAKKGCPVSRALAGTEIRVQADLIE